MALLFADGLDSGLSKFAYTYGTVLWNPTAGIYGGGALEIPSNAGSSVNNAHIILFPYAYNNNYTSNPTTHISFWLRSAATVTNATEAFFLYFEQTSFPGSFGQFSIYGDGKLSAFNWETFSPGTFYRSVNYPRLDDGNWHHIEIALRYGNAPVGYYRLAVDGELIITATGFDNVNDTNPPGFIDNISFRNFRGGTVYIDDIVIWNDLEDKGDNFYTNRMGPLRIYTTRPIADTAQANSTPSSGSDRYLMLNEPTLNTSNSVILDVTGKDLYTMNAVPNVGGPIIGATATVFFSALQSGYGANLRPVVVSNGISYTSNTITNITQTPKMSTIFFNKNFGSSNTIWTLNDINTVNVGFEVLT